MVSSSMDSGPDDGKVIIFTWAVEQDDGLLVTISCF